MKLKIPPPIQTFLAMLMMYGANNLVQINIFDSKYTLFIIVICCLLASFFLISAVLGFKKLKTTVNPLKPETASALVVKGVYKYSRNPMYAGMALFLFSWFLWLGNPINLLIFAGYIFYITEYQIKPEEKALAGIFASEFEMYCKNVRRWL